MSPFPPGDLERFLYPLFFVLMALGEDKYRKEIVYRVGEILAVGGVICLPSPGNSHGAPLICIPCPAMYLSTIKGTIHQSY